MKKLLFLFLIVFVICNGSYIRKNAEPTEKVVAKENTAVTSIPVLEKMTIPETVSVIGVGDMMLGSNYPTSAYLPSNNQNILSGVSGILKDGDITFGNLEGTILESGGTPKTGENCFAFRMPNNTVNYLKDAGFDVLSLANNHSRDFGTAGAKNTMSLLDKAGIHYAGLTECPYTIFEKDGVKFGFCSFGPDGYGGIEHFNDALVVIKELKKKCDIVIVNFHAGAEGQNAQHVTRKTEYFLGENRGDPYHLAREAIDAGADIVFMEGPHVTRAIDLYKNRFIAYSLGDFATYGQFNTTGVYGIAPAIKVFVNSKGEFQSGIIYPIKLIDRGIPIIDKSGAVIKKIIELEKTDVPKAPLIIKDNGVIEKIQLSN
jgi:poly-gamma-glutamate capsule biosynthesis protein CapA/YwtB (metallophosphatase superfamily)